MKKALYNPYDELKEHKCFACSKHNLNGLHMTFYEEGDHVVSEWLPEDKFQGYPNVLHGGIQATLMDEISSWCIQVKLKTAGVTSRLETKYKHPVYCDRGKITLRARMLEFRRNIAQVKVQLFDSDQKICSEAVAKFFVFPEKIAKEKFFYPDFDSFYKDPTIT